MGFVNTGNRQFLTVSNGKIVQRVKENTPGAVSRVTSEGKVVWELRHGGFTGLLVGISIKTGEFKGVETRDWIFDLNDEGQMYQLQVMFDSRYGTTMINALCNPIVDFDKPITISPWAKEVDGKKKSAIYIKQGEDNIEWYFTKENPRGMPQMVQTRYKGKDVWDNTDMMQFLENFVNSEVKPRLGHAPEYTPPSTSNTIGQEKSNGGSPGYVPNYDLAPDSDDLPF